MENLPPTSNSHLNLNFGRENGFSMQTSGPTSDFITGAGCAIAGYAVSRLLDYLFREKDNQQEVITQEVKETARIEGPELLTWQDCHLQGANFQGANLRGANFGTINLNITIMPGGSHS